MNKRFIEFELRTYHGKDYENYIKKMRDKDEDEDYDDGDEWKASVYSDESEPILPKAFPTRVFIDPLRIMSYIEVFSMESAHENPENPIYDTVEIQMEDGLQILVIATIEEFNDKLDKFYNQ